MPSHPVDPPLPVCPYEASVSRHIATAPERLHAIVADQRDGHPHILPKRATYPAVRPAARRL